MKAKLKALSETRMGKFITCYYRRFEASRPTLLAAALAYYAAFSLGPMLILLAGGFGIFLQQRPDLALQVREVLTTLVGEALPFVDRSDRLAQQSFDVLVSILQEGTFLTAAFSIVVLLWSGTNFFTSLQLALEVIFESEKPRPYWRQRLISLFLVLLVSIAIIFEVVSSVILTAVGQALEGMRAGLMGLIDLDMQTWLWLQDFQLRPGFVSRSISAIMLTVAYTLSYRYIPRRGSTWPAAFVGALFTISTTLLARQLMLEFIDRERFNVVYGLITTLVLLLLWFYFSLLLYLLGAVLAAELGIRKGRRHEPRHLLEHDHLQEKEPEVPQETYTKP